jgi:hypothetical protein
MKLRRLIDGRNTEKLVFIPNAIKTSSRRITTAAA